MPKIQPLSLSPCLTDDYFSLCLLIIFPLVCWCPVFRFRAPLMVPSHLSPNMSSIWGRVFGSRTCVPGPQFNTDHSGIVIQVLFSEGRSVFPLMMGAKTGRKPDQRVQQGHASLPVFWWHPNIKECWNYQCKWPHLTGAVDCCYLAKVNSGELRGQRGVLIQRRLQKGLATVLSSSSWPNLGPKSFNWGGKSHSEWVWHHRGAWGPWLHKKGAEEKVRTG